MAALRRSTGAGTHGTLMTVGKSCPMIADPAACPLRRNALISMTRSWRLSWRFRFKTTLDFGLSPRHEQTCPIPFGIAWQLSRTRAADRHRLPIHDCSPGSRKQAHGGPYGSRSVPHGIRGVPADACVSRAACQCPSRASDDHMMPASSASRTRARRSSPWPRASKRSACFDPFSSRRTTNRSVVGEESWPSRNWDVRRSRSPRRGKDGKGRVRPAGHFGNAGVGDPRRHGVACGVHGAEIKG